MRPRPARRAKPPAKLTADEVNQRYLESLAKKSKGKRGGVVYRRLLESVAPLHEERITRLQAEGHPSPAIGALDSLGDILRAAYGPVLADIERSLPEQPDASEEEKAKLRQKRMQAVKSNAGKIFERYVGYAIARALVGTGWAVWHNSRDAKRVFGFDPREWLTVTKEFGDNTVTVDIEGDLLIARPNDEHGSLVLLSVKSSLKDRLHNVPMWNLVKEIALDDGMSRKLGLTARNPDKLRRVVYCLACSDIAEEQRDLDVDPRAKIKFDVALLDYAFASVASPDATHLSEVISAEGREGTFFHRLSAIGRILEYITRRADEGREVSAAEVVRVVREPAEEVRPKALPPLRRGELGQ